MGTNIQELGQTDAREQRVSVTGGLYFVVVVIFRVFLVISYSLFYFLLFYFIFLTSTSRCVQILSSRIGNMWPFPYLILLY